ncbi:hypothetical protein TBLA_0F03560 [Henningerozyma blattae CBS 6284]|uniref:Uncharacterized protein n=1 Tax=Henningerozyma blattae (strain ATCC 34711 / CBS 6284 / DSM 70876 / NBRC 10599 / NRRL Y-10934 / UCD 77-7) TaxID=1071380 RepID=I2H691_HENB6|nr:hypothetical protein TBLA_0F03560 [Tetrapisispora blattae CBS 6284]CCH61893.1 hypothetical protein TBLA_0F03560 [Tetrapisispora blattae CBS 6284]
MQAKTQIIRKPKKLSNETLYYLANQYIDQAYKNSFKIQNESQLIQYYKLIQLSIELCSKLAASRSNFNIHKKNFILFKIVLLLLDNSINYKLIDSQLSTLINQLDLQKKNHYLQNNLHFNCIFVKLWNLPLWKGDPKQYNIALDDTLTYKSYLTTILHHSSHDFGINLQFSIISFIHLFWLIKLNKNKSLIDSTFKHLLSFNNSLPTNHSNFVWINYNSFISLVYLNYILQNNLIIPRVLQSNITSIQASPMSKNLKAWHLIIDLLFLIKRDSNITLKLNEIKSFFDSNSLNLSSLYLNFTTNDDNKLQISLNDIVLKIDLFSIFNYRNLTNILLFLQSISYLINSTEKNSNFALIYLPKIKKNILSIQLNLKSSKNVPLAFHDANQNWYSKFLNLIDFYSLWYDLILNNFTSLPLAKDNDPYFKLISTHLDSTNDNTLQLYQHIIDSPSISNSNSHLKLFALFNSYLILSSRLSQTNSSDDTHSIINKLNNTWSNLNSIFLSNSSNLFTKNNNYFVTFIILWISSHLQPFNSNPLPSTDKEKEFFISNLEKFYQQNSFYSTLTDSTSSSTSQFHLKKSLHLQILLNYIGTRLFEHDLTKISKISKTCFHYSMKFNFHYKFIYILGLWHLINSTSQLNEREIQKTKLN